METKWLFAFSLVALSVVVGCEGVGTSRAPKGVGNATSLSSALPSDQAMITATDPRTHHAINIFLQRQGSAISVRSVVDDAGRRVVESGSTIPDDPNVLPNQTGSLLWSYAQTGFLASCTEMQWSFGSNGAPNTTSTFSPSVTSAGQFAEGSIVPTSSTAAGVYDETVTEKCLSGSTITFTNGYTVGFANVNVIYSAGSPMPSGVPIQNKAFTAVAGQHVELQIALASDSTFEQLVSPSPSTTPYFQVPAPAVAYPYTPGEDPAKNAPATGGSKTDFYWYGGVGAKPVSATFGINGSYYTDPFTESGTVTVNGPALVSATSTTMPVVITTPYPKSPYGTLLAFGSQLATNPPANPGILEYLSGTGAAGGGNGQLAVMQVVNSASTTTDGSTTTLTGYDNCLVFPDQPSPPAVVNNASASWYTYDNPASQLGNSARNVSISESFTDFFTYKPQGGDSIRVTFGILNWSWSAAARNLSTVPTPRPTATGSATPAPTPSPNLGNWVFGTPPPSYSRNPSGMASTALPIFSGPAFNQGGATATPLPCTYPY